LPLSLGGMLITQGLLANGVLKPSPKFGSLPKLAIAGALGYALVLNRLVPDGKGTVLMSATNAKLSLKQVHQKNQSLLLLKTDNVEESIL
ncbi:OCIA domain containing 2, partial [Podarcis lilfordi]